VQDKTCRIDHSHHLKDWETGELRRFLCDQDLDYWKLYDISNNSFFAVDEDGDLGWYGTSRNEDDFYWTISGHGCMENKGTGKVLILNEDNELAVSDINPRRRVPSEWKWSLEPNVKLFNQGTGAPVCYDHYNDRYYCGLLGQDYASFEALSHFDYPEEFA